MKTILLNFCVFALICSCVHSQTIFQEDFATLTTGQDLNGQGSWSNNTSSGGTGGVFGGAPSQVVAFALSYPDYGSSNNSVQSVNTANSDGPGHIFPSAITSGTYYTSFVLNVSDAPSTANTVFDVIRVLNGSAFSTSMRFFVQESGSGYNMGIKIGDSSSPSGITSDVYSYNTAYLVVLKYTINPGATDDELELFVNPDYALGEPAMSTLSAPAPAFEASSNIDRFAFPWNVPNTGRFAGHVGLVSVATSWNALALSNDNFNLSSTTFKYNNSSDSIEFNTNVSGMLNIYTITGKFVNTFQVEDRNSLFLSLDKGAYISNFIARNGEQKTLKFLVTD